ncbi:MAG: response regulator [Deltaproteobacteria bacterium]|nr:response regulator [Deltaproteobacteria bacterium]
MKILIVDDSSVMRKIVMRGLRQAGYGNHDYDEAGDGKQALENVTEAAPDLVLCDWNMPEMTGIELLEALNAQEVKLNFCFVTSEASEDMKSRARENGACGFITKPFTEDTLQDALGDLLG